MPSNHPILCCPLLFLPTVFPSIRSFPVSQLFPSSSQSVGASASVLPMDIQGWFHLGLTDLISLQSKGLSRVFSSTIVRKHQFFNTQPSLWSNSQIHTWLLEKLSLWLYGSLSAKCCLCPLIHYVCHSVSSRKQASFNFMAVVTICSDFGTPENKLSLFPLFPHLFAMKWWDWMPWSLFSEYWVLSQLFHSPLSLSRGTSVPLHFLPLEWCHLDIWDYWYFSWQSWFQLVLHEPSISHNVLCIYVSKFLMEKLFHEVTDGWIPLKRNGALSKTLVSRLGAFSGNLNPIAKEASIAIGYLELCLEYKRISVATISCFHFESPQLRFCDSVSFLKSVSPSLRPLTQ